MEGAESTPALSIYIYKINVNQDTQTNKPCCLKIGLLFKASSTCNLIIIGGCGLDMFKPINRHVNVYLSKKNNNQIVIVHITLIADRVTSGYLADLVVCLT